MSMNISTNYRNLSSGYKINSVADDAAGLSITQKMETEKNGHEMEMANASLEELGIADFDVTKGFNLDDIDKALKKVIFNLRTDTDSDAEETNGRGRAKETGYSGELREYM